MQNWNAYFCGGCADLTKRVLRGPLMPYFEFAIYEPITLDRLKDDALASMPRDRYVLRYADEKTRTAIYLYDERTK